MHDTITVGLPILAILFGILLNQRAVDKLEAKVDRLGARMETFFSVIEGRLDRMQADLSQFYRI